MKLKCSNVYTGNVLIHMCDGNLLYYDKEPLYKINNEYVSIYDLDDMSVVFKVLSRITESEYYKGGITLSSEPKQIGDRFVDKESLKPVFGGTYNDKKITVKQLKKVLKKNS